MVGAWLPIYQIFVNTRFLRVWLRLISVALSPLLPPILSLLPWSLQARNLSIFSQQHRSLGRWKFHMNSGCHQDRPIPLSGWYRRTSSPNMIQGLSLKELFRKLPVTLQISFVSLHLEVLAQTQQGVGSPVSIPKCFRTLQQYCPISCGWNGLVKRQMNLSQKPHETLFPELFATQTAMDLPIVFGS